MRLALILISALLAADTPKEQAKDPNVPWQIQAEFERARADEAESARIHDADIQRESVWLNRATQYCNDTFGPGYQVVRNRGEAMFCKTIQETTK